jgi:exopolysaccharide production protein ExoQ
VNPEFHDDLEPASRLEFGILVLSLLVIGGAWAAFLPGGQLIDKPQTEVTAIQETGDAGKQVLFALIYLVNLGLLVRFTRIRTWRFLGLPLLALLLWCVASIGWSALPDGTVRRVAAMMGTLMVGLYAGQRFDEKQLSAVLCVTAAVAVAGSLLWAIASPPHAFDTDGNLRGLFYHKNVLGSVMALAILSTIYRMLILRQWNLRYRVLLGCSIVTFMLAHSATPIVAMAAALLVLFVARLAMDSDGPIQIMLPAMISVVVAIVVFFGSDLAAASAELLDRDPSMSGRTAIWAFVLPMIAAHPWIGYGYGIFWLGQEAPGAMFWYWARQYELHAHDGYLQLLLDSGVIGLSLFLIALGLVVFRAVRLNGRGRWTFSLWAALFLGYFLVCNITDTELWQSNSMLTTLFIFLVVRANKETATRFVYRLGPVGRVPR